MTWRSTRSVALWAAASAGLVLLGVLCASPVRAATVRIVTPLTPGSASESAALASNSGSRAEGAARFAVAGATWVYRIPAPPGSRCRLRLYGEVPVEVTASLGRARLPVRTSATPETVEVTASMPLSFSLGAAIQFRVRATGSVALRQADALVELHDPTGRGVPTVIRRLMGVGPKGDVSVRLRPPSPRTTFQSAQTYTPSAAPPTDAVLVYSRDAAPHRSYADAGYVVTTMGGFKEPEEVARGNAAEAQTDRDGQAIQLRGSTYMVPTTGRNEKAQTYFRDALLAGSTGVCPEEPEFLTLAGYSEAFKKEWASAYGRPWAAPDSSIDARWASERLKADLTIRQIRSVLEGARRLAPSARRMLAVHSAVTYPDWGVACPHFGLFSLPDLNEVIGQVWSGTARTPVRSSGIRAERTFELAFLEYSSLYHHLRGTPKHLWFTLDPGEDDPNTPWEDYEQHYIPTVLAALMFTGVERYEVMRWPERIYGRAPARYSSVVGAVTGALCDLWRHPDRAVDAGVAGVATLTADSAAYQRGAPAPSDFDGLYAMSMPLVEHGIPIQMLPLERLEEPRYLARTEVLLLSYDHLKPAGPGVHRAIAQWTRAGGCLVVLGGSDAFNGLADSWWRQAGLASPLDDLFTQLGWSLKREAPDPGQPPAPPKDAVTLATGDPAERWLRNREVRTFDLAPVARFNGSVCLRFEDSSPADGSGPCVASVDVRIRDRLAISFRAGSEMETRFLADDDGSQVGSRGRFADRGASWVYRFDRLPIDARITVSIDVGNSFRITAYPGADGSRTLVAEDKSFGPTMTKLKVGPRYPITFYPPPAGAAALYAVPGRTTPPVWQCAVGNGAVIYCGVAPGWLSTTSQTARWTRMLVRRACQLAGVAYTEKSAMTVRRGPLVAVKSLSAEESLEGRYVDLLNADLPLVEDPTVDVGRCGLYLEAGRLGATPRMLAASGRVRATGSQPGLTSFVLSSPSGAPGTARVWLGSKVLVGAKAFSLSGEPIGVEARVEGKTALLRFSCRAEGVVVRVGWR